MQVAERGTPNLKTGRMLHRFFELGVLIKGIDGGLELVAGLLLLFLSPTAINRIVLFFVQGELKEDPTDLLVSLLLHGTGKIMQVKGFASTYLIVHGVVKLMLVGGLARNKRWSFPTAITVFAAFTAYQLYRLGHKHSLFLAIVTPLDIIVVLLVIAEYRRVRMAERTLPRPEVK